MQAMYTTETIAKATIIAHIGTNALCIGAFWIFACLLSQKEANMFSCLIIYFIVSFELMFHVLRNMGKFMELQ